MRTITRRLSPFDYRGIFIHHLFKKYDTYFIMKHSTHVYLPDDRVYIIHHFFIYKYDTNDIMNYSTHAHARLLWYFSH